MKALILGRCMYLALLALSALALELQAADAAFLLPKNGGQLNVRDFGAKGDGKSDDTEAFRKAIKDEDPQSRFIYVPNGTYLLSGTIGWRLRRSLVGESRDGVVLKLKDNCPAYKDKAKSKPMVQTALEGNYGNDSRANAAFDNYLVNLSLNTGKGNPGAIALQHTTHNLGVVENLRLISGDGAGAIALDLSQTEFGPGMITNLEIDGFDVGIRTSGNVSNTVLDHISLKRQKVAGIENNHPLTIHDLRSDNSVPAIRNSDGWMSQVVLVDADLKGGAKDSYAIESLGHVTLRNVKTQGYAAALKDHDKVIPGSALDFYLSEATQTLFPSKASGLGLPLENPPAIFLEPVSKWLVLEGKGKADMTAELQAAIDSGAQTIYFKPGDYTIRNTVIVRGKVRRLITLFGGAGANIGANIDDVGRDKPFLRIAGDAKQPPLSIEGVNFSAWPHMPLAVELAGPRTVYMKYVRCGHPGGKLRSLPEAKGGKLFMDEMPTLLDLAPGLSVWVRQANPENNPYEAGRALPTYILNRGSKVSILGMKTEAPAIHVITLDSGSTEILGGFFRDHVGFEETNKKPLSFPGLPTLPQEVMTELNQGIPAFITIDAQVSASYVQYAWQPGSARDLQAIEMRGKIVKTLRLGPNNLPLGLYSAVPTGTDKPAAK